MQVGINDMIKRVRSISVDETIQEAVENTSVQLLRIQKLQMLKGKAADGGLIGKYKNKGYAISKHLQNPLAGMGNVDLRRTGEFFRGMFVDPRELSVVIDSADSKTQNLIDKYGSEIFGLNKTYAREYSKEYMAEEATKIFKKKLQGG